MAINKRARSYLFLYVFIGFVIIYAILDFKASRNVSGVTGYRGNVHVILVSILTILSLYYYFSSISSRPTLTSVSISLWLIAIWIAVVNLLQASNIWTVAIHIGLSCLWILTYHFFSSYLRRFPEAFERIKFCIGILFLFYVFSAFYASYTIRNSFGHIAVLNLAYNVLVFFPWLTLAKDNKMRKLGVGLVVLVILVSMKRGAIVVFPLMYCSFMLTRAIVSKHSITSTISNMLLFLTICFLGLFIADQVSNGFLSNRFSSKQLADGSGRAHAYVAAIQEISRRSDLDLFLGGGSGSSIAYFGTGVHNEWLEFLFSFGIGGVILYALLFIALGFENIKLMRNKSPYAPTYAMAIVYMLVVGMYGGIYFVHTTLYVMALFGAIDGLAAITSSKQENTLCAHPYRPQ